MRKIFAIFVAFCTCFSLFSCEDTPTKKPNSRVYYDYFDTYGTLSDYSGASYSDFSKVADEVEAILADYHELCDIYNTYEGKNNLATLNAMAGKGPVTLDERLIRLLEYSKEIYYITNGETNVAFGAVLKIWHEHRELGKENPELATLPDSAILDEANRHTDIEKIIIDTEAGTVELLDPEMSIDVGAVAKGYVVEMVAKHLHGRDLNSYYFNYGGNIRAIGTYENGEAFPGYVQNTVLGGYAASFELRDEALVTSGGYARYYTVGGVDYHHIIDKDTLFPKNDYVSVSVKAPSSALADALSTALFNMTLSEAEALVGSLSDVSAVFVKSDGEVFKIGIIE